MALKFEAMRQSERVRDYDTDDKPITAHAWAVITFDSMVGAWVPYIEGMGLTEEKAKFLAAALQDYYQRLEDES